MPQWAKIAHIVIYLVRKRIIVTIFENAVEM